MKQFRKALWGLVLIIIGLIWGLNALGFTRWDITLIDGWWTLFIIVPCLIGLVSERKKTGNLIGLGIGVVLFLCCQGILNFDLIWKLAFPVILVIWGLSFIFSDVFHKKAREEIKRLNSRIPEGNECCATFSSQTVNYNGEVFTGTTLTAVFGGLECDLRDAIIQEDQVINCTAVFGGIDLYVPRDVKIKVQSTSIFGGVSDKESRAISADAKTIYINATCLFGGVEVK